MAKFPKKKMPSGSEEPAKEASVLHHDAPVVAERSCEKSAPKTDVPRLTKITVKIAACGLLLENELKRQKAAGLVERYGQLVLDDLLLYPDKMHILPRSKAVEKAILDGWIVDMGGYH